MRRFFMTPWTPGRNNSCCNLSHIVSDSSFRIGSMALPKFTSSGGSISFSIFSLMFPARDFILVAMNAVMPNLPWTSKLAPHCTRAAIHSLFELCAAWCKGVQPSVSIRSGSPRTLSNIGMASSRLFRAAMCKGARPLPFSLSRRSTTLEWAVCIASSASRQSSLPQKTAAVRGVQPFSSLKLGSAFCFSSSFTAAAVDCPISRTSVRLHCKRLSTSPSTTALSLFISSTSRTSRLRTLAALKAAHSMSLLWIEVSAPRSRSCLMNTSSHLSAA
mmetsp:Transcript_10178/g.27165  ORF Transcript_10178/g.27165 Transcript_10178/m.27165 type:complete len:274 (+) Transcript_10178:903-1724(+)